MNELRITRHAQERMQQRSMNGRDLYAILSYGEDFGGAGVVLTNKNADAQIHEFRAQIDSLKASDATGGAEAEIRDLKVEIDRVDRLRNRKVVVADGYVVTCYPRDTRRLPRSRQHARSGGRGMRRAW